MDNQDNILAGAASNFIKQNPDKAKAMALKSGKFVGKVAYQNKDKIANYAMENREQLGQMAYENRE
jgi:hypothetical protein